MGWEVYWILEFGCWRLARGSCPLAFGRSEVLLGVGLGCAHVGHLIFIIVVTVTVTGITAAVPRHRRRLLVGA
ncbi:uncharacterized protein J3D65DRAFT_622727 [Phyllosticta citribraziliensis]|uniref:Uncharacterized protein n=1 Tax=Phyllosticta citribraziliensis TaxID=989973 RepID=A0ABR1LU31_9PEZI